MNNSIPHTTGRRSPPPFGIRKSLSPWMYHPGGENQRSIDFSNLFSFSVMWETVLEKWTFQSQPLLPPFSTVRDRKKSCHAPGVYVQYYYGWICLFFCTGKMEESPPPPFAAINGKNAKKRGGKGLCRKRRRKIFLISFFSSRDFLTKAQTADFKKEEGKREEAQKIRKIRKILERSR